MLRKLFARGHKQFASAKTEEQTSFPVGGLVTPGSKGRRKGIQEFGKRIIAPIIFFSAVVVVWELALPLTGVHEIILPRPSQIYLAFVRVQSQLAEHAVVTVVEILAGFALGTGVGMLMGVGIAYSKPLQVILYPAAIFVKVIPIIAIAPLLVLWFGFDIWSKVAATAIISFFPMVVSTATGLRSVNPSLIDLLRVVSAKERQVFFEVKLPWSFPHVFSALKISATLSVIGAVVGEFVGAKKGLGLYLLIQMSYLETARVFAIIVTLAVIGMIFFAGVVIAEKLVAPWAETQTS